MNRRTVLKQLAISSTAAFLLPSCLLDEKKVSVALTNLKITSADEELLGLLADIIVPETDTPGARSLKAHQFALVMVDDCMTKEDQDKYLQGMRSFKETIGKTRGKSLDSASEAERIDMLTAFENNKEPLPEDVNMFYWRTKRYILQGYLSSQHFLTNVKKYELVPGPVFKGCVPVSNNLKSNT
jgi:hypothetical protein